MRLTVAFILCILCFKAYPQVQNIEQLYSQALNSYVKADTSIKLSDTLYIDFQENVDALKIKCHSVNMVALDKRNWKTYFKQSGDQLPYIQIVSDSVIGDTARIALYQYILEKSRKEDGRDFQGVRGYRFGYKACNLCLVPINSSLNKETKVILPSYTLVNPAFSNSLPGFMGGSPLKKPQHLDVRIIL